MMDAATQDLLIQRADTVWKRLRGWLGRRSLGANEALWLSPCRGVHTFGMHMPIDVVFLDARANVIRIVSALPPGRAALCWRAVSVLELAAGTLSRPGARDQVERAMAAFIAKPQKSTPKPDISI